MDSADMSVANRKKNSDLGISIVSLFQENWDLPFVTDGSDGRKLSYRDFYARVVTYHAKLQELGYRPGDAMVVIMHNSLTLLVLYFASLCAGIRIIPIDPFKGKDERADILAQVNYKHIIVDGSIPDMSIATVLRADEFTDAGVSVSYANRGDLFRAVDYTQPYLITFTSGSTGKPKGVMHSADNLFRSARAFSQVFHFGREHVFYHNLPMTYMAGILNQIFLPFISGSRIVLGDRFSVSTIGTFWKKPIAYSVNTFWLIPTILSLLLKLDRGSEGESYTKAGRMICCVGTAPLDQKLRGGFEKRYQMPVFESYGLSETLFVSSQSPAGATKGDVGTPLEGCTINAAPDGELLIACEWMFLGYLGQEDAPTDFFASGDIGHRDAEGRLFITGRKKDIIIRGGVNISPFRIEQFIARKNIFGEVVIIGIQDPTMGEKVVCFFTDSERSSRESVNKLNRAIVSDLGPEYRIDEFVALDEIPRNINGKVDTLKLREHFGMSV